MEIKKQRTILVICIILLVFLIFSAFKQKTTYVNMIYNCSTVDTSKEIDLLREPNEMVFRYVNLPLEYSYGSAAIPLTVSALLSTGDILELGMGMYSTPLLHNLGAHSNRHVVSVETNLEWLQKFIIYNSTRTHKLYHLSKSELNLYGLNKLWGLVLVDHGDAAARSLNVLNFSKLAMIVLIHDAEQSSEHMYNYVKNKLRDAYKYSCKYSPFSSKEKTSTTSTLILSNFINLDNLKDLFGRISNDFGHVACDVNF
jgi:hypothetical protein